MANRTTLRLYQIHDIVAEQMQGPILRYRTNGPAIRDFQQVLGMKDTALGKNPADYRLVCVGEQYEDTGHLVPYEVVETVLNGRDYVATQTTETAR